MASADESTGEFCQTFKEELTPILKLPKYSRGRNTPKLILRGQHHPDTKTRQRSHKKRILQTNITVEHRFKKPQQTKVQDQMASQVNSTKHLDTS